MQKEPHFTHCSLERIGSGLRICASSMRAAAAERMEIRIRGVV